MKMKTKTRGEGGEAKGRKPACTYVLCMID